MLMYCRSMRLAERQSLSGAARGWAKLRNWVRGNASGTSQARHLIEKGDFKAARRCIERLPANHLQSGLLAASLLEAEGRLDELAEYLARLVEKFGLTADLCVRYDRALLQIGRFDVAETHFLAVRQALANPTDCLSEMATIADQEQNFGIAVRRWKALCGLQPDHRDFHESYIRSLIEILETQTASDHFDSVAATFCDPAFHMLEVDILEAQLRFKEALSALDCLAETWGESPEIAFKRGVCLRGDGRYAEAEELFQAQQRRQPKNIEVARELAKTADAARDYTLAAERWRALCNAYPKKTALHSGYIDSLISLADLEVAEAHYDRVREKLGNLHFNYNQLIKIRHAAQNINAVEKVIDTQLDRFRHGRVPLRLRAAMLNHRAQFLQRSYLNTGDAKALGRMKTAIEERLVLQPCNVASRIKLSKVLVALGMEHPAERMIGDLPRTLHPAIVDMKMWLASRAGDHDASLALWRQRKQVHYIPHIRPCPPGSLKRKDENVVGKGEDEIRIFTAIRNEMQRLPWFLEYYRSLGVNRFFFVDNDSTDGSRAFLLEQPDVHVFWTDGSYAEAYSGMRWINQLVRGYGKSGWISYVDVDEALVFPGIETAGLRGLTDYMAANDQEALRAFMLDMFAEHATRQNETEATDFVRAYPFFDSQIDMHATTNCPYVFVRGGTRRAFGWGENLTKTPLVRGGRDISYLMSSHVISPARVSDVSAVLLHYKLSGNFLDAVQDDIANNTRMSACLRRHVHYARRLQSQDGNMQFTNAFTKRYSGSEQLVSLGLMSAPGAYYEGVEHRKKAHG